MPTGTIGRTLSYLPVTQGKEAEVLNREVIPTVRELAQALAGAGAAVDDSAAIVTAILTRLDAIEVRLHALDGL